MLQTLKDQFAFFGQFRKRFETTGAIAPSSSFLAKSMTRFLSERDRTVPVRVLEIGPGTGPVTDKIVGLLGSADQFDLVELNETFVDLLQQRFQSNPKWQAVVASHVFISCRCNSSKPQHPMILSSPACR